MFIIGIILVIFYIHILFKSVHRLVWNVLRKIYVKGIFEKIENARLQRERVWLEYNHRFRGISSFKEKEREHEEIYKILKALTEEISGIDPRIITYLMTDSERKKYEGVFESLEESEYDLNRTKVQIEILNSKEFKNLDEKRLVDLLDILNIDDLIQIKNDPYNSKARHIFNSNSVENSCKNA